MEGKMDIRIHEYQWRSEKNKIKRDDETKL